MSAFSTGKAFEITYVRLKFYTSRPESFAIYKRTQEDGPWLPYQYYSASCKKTYGKHANAYIRPGDDERTSLCTDEFSDISPLTGGNVAFSTLEGRPSAYNFDQSLVLQVRTTNRHCSSYMRTNYSRAHAREPRSYFQIVVEEVMVCLDLINIDEAARGLCWINGALLRETEGVVGTVKQDFKKVNKHSM